MTPPRGSFGSGYFGYGLFGVGSDQFPAFIDEIAFDSDPFDDDQVYETVSDSVISRSVRRGRQSEADQSITGTGTLELLDDDRRYDPENADGPYFPGVLPMRRMRCTSTIDGETYEVFQVFIDIEDGWQRDESDPAVAMVSVPGNDAFDVLAARKLTSASSFPEQLTGARINAVLDAIGWPADLRNIDDGHELVQALASDDVADVDALTLIRDAERTEPGFVFVDGGGRIVFHDRQRRLQPPYTTVQATFCDADNIADGRLPYKRLKTRQSQILNDVRIGPRDLATQTATDDDSIARFSQRTDGPTPTLHTTEAKAKSAANWRLSRSKDRVTRFEELELELNADPELWKQALARKIGDRIAVIRTPQGGTAPETTECHIENIALDIGPGVAGTCVWRLSPADQTTYWRAGTAGFGEAGITTRAVY
jgi:hypothetical protein